VPQISQKRPRKDWLVNEEKGEIDAKEGKEGKVERKSSKKGSRNVILRHAKVGQKKMAYSVIARFTRPRKGEEGWGKKGGIIRKERRKGGLHRRRGTGNKT